MKKLIYCLVICLMPSYLFSQSALNNKCFYAYLNKADSAYANNDFALANEYFNKAQKIEPITLNVEVVKILYTKYKLNGTKNLTKEIKTFKINPNTLDKYLNMSLYKNDTIYKEAFKNAIKNINFKRDKINILQEQLLYNISDFDQTLRIRNVDLEKEYLDKAMIITDEASFEQLMNFFKQNNPNIDFKAFSEPSNIGVLAMLIHNVTRGSIMKKYNTQSDSLAYELLKKQIISPAMFSGIHYHFLKSTGEKNYDIFGLDYYSNIDNYSNEELIKIDSIRLDYGLPTLRQNTIIQNKKIQPELINGIANPIEYCGCK